MSTAPQATGRRRRPHRDDVRRALLDSAARVFARHGIDRATVDDVASDAGFTKGAVYSNFDSKEGLVAALIADRTSAYLDLGLAAVEKLGDPMSVQAQLLGDRLSIAGDEQRDWHLLVVELWQRAVRADGTDDADHSFREHRESLRAKITAAITEHAAGSGTTLPMPAPELATVLIALANGLAMERMLAPDDVPPDLMGRALALLVGQGATSGADPDQSI